MPSSDFLSFNPGPDAESTSGASATEPSPSDFNFTGSLMDRAARRGTLLGDIDLRARRILAGQSSDEPVLETDRYRLSQMEGEQAVAAARRRITVAETDAHYQRLAKSEDLLHRAAIEAPQLAARLDAETDPDAIESHAADFLSRYAQVAGTPEFGARFDRLAAPVSQIVATKPAALRQRYAAAARGLWPMLDPDDPDSFRRIEASPFFEIARRDPEFARAFGEAKRRSTAGAGRSVALRLPSQSESLGEASSTVEIDQRPTEDNELAVEEPDAVDGAETAVAPAPATALEASEILHFDGAYRGPLPMQAPELPSPGTVPTAAQGEIISSSRVAGPVRGNLDDFKYNGGRRLDDPLTELRSTRRPPGIRWPQRPPPPTTLPNPPTSAPKSPTSAPPKGGPSPLPLKLLNSAESSVGLMQGSLEMGQRYIANAKFNALQVARAAYLRGDISAEDYVDIGDGVLALKFDNPGIAQGAEEHFTKVITASVERRLDHIAEERKAAATEPGSQPLPVSLDANQLVYRAQQGESIPVHRIGGRDNLTLKESEKTPDEFGKWGLSVLLGGTPQQAADLMRQKFSGSRLRKESMVTGTATIESVMNAGYTVVPDYTDKLPNHALINHSGGLAAFEANIEKLRAVLIDVPTPP